MQADIIPKLLIKNLRAVPSKKPDKHLKELEKLSPGAAYLYRKVIIPKLDGKTVKTSELDMSEFELNDIETVCNYYHRSISVAGEKNKPLFLLYNAITELRPLNTRTSFL